MGHEGAAPAGTGETMGTTTTTTVAKMCDTVEIVRIKREVEEGDDEVDAYYENCPLNFQQPSIFELTRRETMKKMGKVTKEAVIQKVLQKVIFIRDCDIIMPNYDPTMEQDEGCDVKPDLLPEFPKNSPNYEPQLSIVCSSNLPYCRFGCVCESVNCPDMYDEHYEKHCRDTGDPACMYGCICEHPGPHLNGESKWITCRPYKYKKQRAKDDEDCGFVPIHMREQMREGRPKRKAQAPTRYRPDFSVSEKELRTYENGSSNGSNSNGYSKRTSRPRRRLCAQEDDDDDGSDDSDERIISDKKRSLSRSSECYSSPPKKGRPTKIQAARNLREPSKRERKPRKLDLPEPKPKRPYRKSTGSGAVVNGVSSPQDTDLGQDTVEIGTEIIVTLGLSLHVIDIQAASRTCQGMFAVLRRSTCHIISFVSWDEGCNSRPFIQDLKYRFTSSRANQSDWVDGTDILILPNVKTEDTMWLFYSIKRNFRNWDSIMCKELHSIIKTQLLHEVIERHRGPAIQNGVSRVVDISYLNSNRREEPSSYKCGPLYLYFGKKGDVYWFGVPPKIYIQKNINNTIVNPNTLIKRRQTLKRRHRNTAASNPNTTATPVGQLKLKPKFQTVFISPKGTLAESGPLVLNKTVVRVPPPLRRIEPSLPKMYSESQVGVKPAIQTEIKPSCAQKLNPKGNSAPHFQVLKIPKEEVPDSPIEVLTILDDEEVTEPSVEVLKIPKEEVTEPSAEILMIAKEEVTQPLAGALTIPKEEATESSVQVLRIPKEERTEPQPSDEVILNEEVTEPFKTQALDQDQGFAIPKEEVTDPSIEVLTIPKQENNAPSMDMLAIPKDEVTAPRIEETALHIVQVTSPSAEVLTIPNEEMRYHSPSVEFLTISNEEVTVPSSIQVLTILKEEVTAPESEGSMP